MAKGVKTGGRKKGTPNKVTVTIKEEIERVYQELGGTAAFHEWARSNKSAFYAGILPRILPKEMTGKDGGDIAHTVTVVVKRDSNFFGRGAITRTHAAPNPDPPKPGPIQDGGVRPAVGEDGAGPDGGS